MNEPRSTVADRRTQSPSVICVGAGIGGLSAALSLAAEGIQVTLLEQHASTGGKMRQCSIGEQLIDCGPTVFTMRWIFDELFAKAGLALDEQITLHRSELLARHSWPDSESLDLFSDVDRSAEAIRDFAGGNEALNYRRFAQQCEDFGVEFAVDHADAVQ